MGEKKSKVVNYPIKKEVLAPEAQMTLTVCGGLRTPYLVLLPVKAANIVK